MAEGLTKKSVVGDVEVTSSVEDGALVHRFTTNREGLLSMIDEVFYQQAESKRIAEESEEISELLAGAKTDDDKGLILGKFAGSPVLEAILDTERRSE